MVGSFVGIYFRNTDDDTHAIYLSYVCLSPSANAAEVGDSIFTVYDEEGGYCMTRPEMENAVNSGAVYFLRYDPV